MKKLLVTKRNNAQENFDISKIDKQLSRAIEGLEYVNKEEILQDIVQQLYSGVTTKEIDSALTLSARSKIEFEPNYSYVAGRLLLFQIYKEVLGGVNLEYDRYFDKYIHTFRDHVKLMVKDGKYDKRMLEFDFDKLEEALKPERDYKFKYLGIQTISDRYLLRDNNTKKLRELPQWFWMRVAMGVCFKENNIDKNEWAIKFYNMLSTFKACFSSPSLFNSGTNINQLSSCFSPESLVITDSGLKEIGNIVIGDKVLSQNGVFNKVIATKRKNSDKKIYTLKMHGTLNNVELFKVTEDHLFSCVKFEEVNCIRQNIKHPCIPYQGKLPKCKKLKNNYSTECSRLCDNFETYIKWTKVSDLKSKDFIEVLYPKVEKPLSYSISNILDDPKFIVEDNKIYQLRMDEKRVQLGIIDELTKNKTVKSVNNNINVDYKFMLWLGYYFSEGYCHQGDAIVFTFNTKELDYINDVVNLTKEIFDVESCVNINKDGSTNVKIHSSILTKFILKIVGTGFEHKYLSKDFMELPKDILRGFIIGCYRGDSCTIKGKMQLSFSNKFLCYQVFQILLKLGYLPVLAKAFMGVLAKVQSYTVTINYIGSEDIVKEIGKDLHKIGEIKVKNSKTNCARFFINNRAFYAIDEIKEIEYQGDVVDIEVENDPSFAINLLCAHNCYLSSISDSADGIMGCFHQQALLSKHAGGLGLDVCNIRGSGSLIKSNGGKASGPIPYIKILNDIIVAFDQSGLRKGVCNVYIEPWHINVQEFLNLKKTVGDERLRAHDVNTSLWIPDLFMDYVEKDKEWYLFCPGECPDLHSSYGETFKNLYEYYIELAKGRVLKNFKVIKAKTLMRDILRSIAETSHPFCTFKDSCNLRYTDKHQGTINSANLCVEYLRHSIPSEWNKGIKTKVGEIAVCNLSSLNLVEHINPFNGEFNWQELKDTLKLQVRAADNVIDINYNPVEEAELSNKRHRPIGIGRMGWADILHIKGLQHDSEESVKLAGELGEYVSMQVISASIDLAKERGAYPTYKGSEWSKGKLPVDLYYEHCEKRGIKVEQDESMAWIPIRQKLAKYGIRNASNQCIAPTATINSICGVSPCIDPDFSMLYVYTTLSGSFTCINEYFVKELRDRGLWNRELYARLKEVAGECEKLEEIPLEIRNKYKSAFKQDVFKLIEITANAQKWIDMGISFNIYYDGNSMKDLYDIYNYGWKNLIKTFYYLRSKAASKIEGVTNIFVPTSSPDKRSCSLEAFKRGEECSSCS